MSHAEPRIPSHESALAERVAEFCLRDYSPPPSNLRSSFPTSALWQRVSQTRTELWLDTGDIAAIRKLWTQEFSALTTNNSLLNKEVQTGIYDALVPKAAAMLRAAEPKIDAASLVLEIAFVLNAVHGLKLVQTFDADVSVELHTDLANDADASYQYGKRFAAIEPGRFIVKVPLTPAGIVAARRLSDDGIRVNFTLGFSARQNYAIARLARPTYVNVFMGRLNAFVADNGLGDGRNVGEKATLSSQRMLRMLVEDTKQIGASIRNGRQVADLIGLDVMTIPTAAAAEFVELAPAKVDDHTTDDPAVELASHADRAQVGVFWEVPTSFTDVVDRLAQNDVAVGDGHEIRAALGGMFPTLSADERARVLAESKIPKAKSWQAKVDAGQASWDGLLTEAAMQSFAADQRALDDRIRRSL